MDLICREGDFIVFVEVKTRRNFAFGRPHEAVDRAKQQLIARGAREWMRRLGGEEMYHRFDIVEVLAEPGKPPAFQIVRNAF